MHLADLRQQLASRGARPDHAERVLRRWIQGLSQDSRHRRVDDFLPLALRRDLPGLLESWGALTRLREAKAADDGARRLLLELGDGQLIESVLLPRAGLCVSTQVGCAVRCVFCETGKSGLLRQLGSAEILAQVVLARSLARVQKVVFMGMGEPAHNLAAVLDAIELLGTQGQIGHKNLVFSTVGDLRVFERLPLGIVKPALALSLHSTVPERRARLLPHAARLAPAELVELGEDYARRTHYPIQYQWTLMEGINDDAEELEGLVRLLRGKYAVLNLIPYNTVSGAAFRRPDWQRTADLARHLHGRGILTKLRQSAGQDVEAGCGQLRARAPVALRVLAPRR